MIRFARGADHVLTPTPVDAGSIVRRDDITAGETTTTRSIITHRALAGSTGDDPPAGVADLGIEVLIT